LTLRAMVGGQCGKTAKFVFLIASNSVKNRAEWQISEVQAN